MVAQNSTAATSGAPTMAASIIETTVMHFQRLSKLAATGALTGSAMPTTQKYSGRRLLVLNSYRTSQDAVATMILSQDRTHPLQPRLRLHPYLLVRYSRVGSVGVKRTEVRHAV
jgi:hypothetical protein